MEAPGSHSKVRAALVKAQAAMEAAKKDSTNPFHKSKYSDLASVEAALKDPFAKNGLGWRHEVWSDKEGVYVECIIFHESGEELSQKHPLFLPLSGAYTPQTVGSAVTYGRRYTLQSAAGIVSDDDDGNAASVTSVAPPPSRGGQHSTAPVTVPVDTKPAATSSQAPGPYDMDMAAEFANEPSPKDVAWASGAGFKKTWGKEKRLTSELSDKDVRYWMKRTMDDIRDPAKAKWKLRAERDLAELQAVMAERGLS